MFERTVAINKIRSMTKRHRVIQGGTWAAKTFSIMAVGIDTAAKDGTVDMIVVAQSITSLKKGAIKDFLNIMSMTGRFIPSRWNKSERIYSFANGATIQFDSFDSEGKAKAAGKRTHLFINEANHIPFKIADALMTRTTSTIWIDFNPDSEFWAHNELKNSELIVLTYADNHLTPDSVIQDFADKLEKAYHDPFGNHEDPKNIKSKYWSNWCSVYLRGEIGSLEGVIFSNYSIVDSVPKKARFIGYGLDFGFTNDPTAAIGVWYLDGEYYLDEICYQTGMMNRDISKTIRRYLPSVSSIGVADSAEPRTIAELRQMGLKLKEAKKPSGSVNHGISLVQSFNFNVTSRSANLIFEFRNYRWLEDKTGERTNVPMDKHNHLMDALRYFASVFLKHKAKGNDGHRKSGVFA